VHDDQEMLQCNDNLQMDNNIFWLFEMKAPAARLGGVLPSGLCWTQPGKRLPEARHARKAALIVASSGLGQSLLAVSKRPKRSASHTP